MWYREPPPSSNFIVRKGCRWHGTSSTFATLFSSVLVAAGLFPLSLVWCIYSCASFGWCWRSAERWDGWMWAKHMADNDVGLCEVLEWKRRQYTVTVWCGRILGNCISMNRDFSYYFVELLSNLSSVMSIIEVFYVPELLSVYHHNMIISYIWF